MPDCCVVDFWRFFVNHITFFIRFGLCFSYRYRYFTLVKVNLSLATKEVKLMLTNLRDAFRDQSKVTKHGTIRFVRYGFLWVCCSDFFLYIFGFKNAVTLKTRWGSVKVIGNMSLFDRAHMTSYWVYWRSIVTIVLVSFLRYSMSRNVVTLKSGSEVTQGH